MAWSLGQCKKLYKMLPVSAEAKHENSKEFQPTSQKLWGFFLSFWFFVVGFFCLA